MGIAFIFPGQGSQKVGMGKDLITSFKSVEIFLQDLSDMFSLNLINLMLYDNNNKLSETKYSQPAIFALSAVIMHTLEKEYGFNINNHIDFVAGHSLGEYSALYAAKIFNLPDIVTLIKTRSKAMQNAQVPYTTGMLAAVGNDLNQEILLTIIKENTLNNEVCVIANYNSNNQFILSGHIKSLNIIADIIKQHSNKNKAIMLNVSAGFHSPLMKEAVESMQNMVASMQGSIHSNIKILSNVTGDIVKSENELKKLMIKQIYSPVKWIHEINTITKHNIYNMYEVGNSKVLARLNMNIDSNIKTKQLYSIESLKNFIN